MLLVAVVVVPAAGSAQQTPATVTGTVADETGGVLPGVGVTLQRAGAQTPVEAVTDEQGRYRFEGVGEGQAELIFRVINFSDVRRVVAVPSSGTVTANAVMLVSVSADIVITAPRTFRNLAEIDNPAENLVGVASAGSEGAVTAAQLAVRPVNRATEVLETVPGLVISQHSGEGKANRYYLRGMNLDHGFDFAQTIAGFPVNMPTHAHAQGYADSNFLIPELVSGVQFRKGPYYAENGDFSTAGSANISYFNVLERPIVSVTGGSFDYGRFFGAASPRVGRGNLLAAFEFERDNGPWVSPNGKDKYQRHHPLQPGQRPQRLFRDVPRLLESLALDRPDSAARRRRRRDRSLRLHRGDRRRRDLSLCRRLRLAALAHQRFDPDHGVPAALRRAALSQLHVLHGRPRERRPVRAVRGALDGRREGDLSPARTE